MDEEVSILAPLVDGREAPSSERKLSLEVWALATILSLTRSMGLNPCRSLSLHRDPEAEAEA